ncbi:hypothetical protein B296_00052442 [Ensete ventricosum]|uniref:Uncharacterized protein n=1 Tax=Ensete ventricosum TaxID=4639 RepID=A0A426YCH1_ENSVE|nr:hypothetical protein B296_00052442 [Ensete ventricosum]
MLRWAKVAVICFKCRELKILWNKLFLDLRHEGGSDYGALLELNFRLDEFLLDLVHLSVLVIGACRSVAFPRGPKGAPREVVRPHRRVIVRLRVAPVRVRPHVVLLGRSVAVVPTTTSVEGCER